MSEHSIFLPDESATTALAAEFSGCLKHWRGERVVVHLDGDLGSGKTTFVRGFLCAAGFAGKVKSPTYTLLEQYTVFGHNVLHFDLYRFAEPQEWEEAGFDDVLMPPVWAFVEWADCATGFVPSADIHIEFAVREAGRMCKISSHSADGQEIFTLWQHLPDGRF